MLLLVSTASDAGQQAFSWLRSLGGLGQILLAVIDNSVIPTPGGMDLLTVILTARHTDLWWYYAGMATIGSLLGGWLTFRLGRKGGKESLEKKLSAKQAEKIFAKFEKNGFLAIFVPALLPPPVPMSPFLLAAGALDYPTKKFFAALAAGRAIRYAIVALLAKTYGKQIIVFLDSYKWWVLGIFLSMVAVSAIAGVVAWRRGNKSSGSKPGSKPGAKPSYREETSAA